jgi:hypothetical protein
MDTGDQDAGFGAGPPPGAAGVLAVAGGSGGAWTVRGDPAALRRAGARLRAMGWSEFAGALETGAGEVRVREEWGKGRAALGAAARAADLVVVEAAPAGRR